MQPAYAPQPGITRTAEVNQPGIGEQPAYFAPQPNYPTGNPDSYFGFSGAQAGNAGAPAYVAQPAYLSPQSVPANPNPNSSADIYKF